MPVVSSNSDQRAPILAEPPPPQQPPPPPQPPSPQQPPSQPLPQQPPPQLQQAISMQQEAGQASAAGEPLNDAFTVTFGDRAENHAGMQMIGQAAASGLSLQRLTDIKDQLTAMGTRCMLADLRVLAQAYDVPEAAVLVIRGGINSLLQNPVAEAAMLRELRNMPTDKKFWNKGTVMRRHSCHNNTMGDFDQEPDIANKRGTVVNFADYPVTNQLRNVLTELLNAPAPLVGELNHYYDVDHPKVGIGWHGDKERVFVAGARLGPGADGMPLKYQWFLHGHPIGAEGILELNAGDIYIASMKAVGTDWHKRKVPTLRHAAGKASSEKARSKKRKADEVAPDPVVLVPLAAE